MPELSDWFVKHSKFLIALVALTIAYQKLRGDLDLALTEVHRIVMVVEQQQHEFQDVQRKQERMDQNLVDFRQSYERDMSRYIRETPGR